MRLSNCFEDGPRGAGEAALCTMDEAAPLPGSVLLVPPRSIPWPRWHLQARSSCDIHVQAAAGGWGMTGLRGPLEDCGLVAATLTPTPYATAGRRERQEERATEAKIFISSSPHPIW